MKNNVISVDPGVGGAIAFTSRSGAVITVPMPTLPKRKKKYSTVEKAYHQVSSINNMLGLAILACQTNNVPFYIENVHARPSDSPKTAAALVSNYYAWLATAYAMLKRPTCIKPRSPMQWQNQLGFLLPSGSGEVAYKARKKALQNFATKKFPKMDQASFDKNKCVKLKPWRPTAKTADALCILWVYAGGK